MAYGPDALEEREIRDPAEIQGFLHRFPVVWVDVHGVSDAKWIGELGKLFGLHHLATEDIINVGQRAKVEEYDDHLFIVTRMVRQTDHLETEQVSLFLSERFVFTFQEHDGDCLDCVRNRIRKATGRIRRAGPDYLAYAVLDAIIDHYFPVLEHYGEVLDDLEERIVGQPDKTLATWIHRVRRELMTLRWAIWPQREAINALLRESTPFVTAETRVYLRDCYDHAVRIIDLIENYRDLASGLMEAYLSSLSTAMNEVMKVLAIFAALFIPLTFIAGIYGMNFDSEVSPYNMPELHWFFGYPAALTLMAIVAVGMLVYFRRKGWIGSSARHDRDVEEPPTRPAAP